MGLSLNALNEISKFFVLPLVDLTMLSAVNTVAFVFNSILSILILKEKF